MATVYTQICPPDVKNSQVLCDEDALRTLFALSMSAMYKEEVPLYGDLVDIVQEVNAKVIATIEEDTSPVAQKWKSESERLDLERHGAIRLGSPYELAIIRRVFRLIGLYPVGYYDLSVANLPMHATAFRPISPKSLSSNPFRIFTTLLRPELLEPSVRALALSFIGRRMIFTNDLLRLINIGENQGGFLPDEGQVFIAEAMKTFKWKHLAASSIQEYTRLKAEHPILADIACFDTAHINHLTPRTLDIDEAHQVMKKRQLRVKSRIEGPPPRKIPILLRQTSFLALEEAIAFRSDAQNSTGQMNMVTGSHKARFGEIEQRGAALTHKGRKLYDEILGEAMDKAKKRQSTPEETDDIVKETFQKFPDTWEQLVENGLVYCTYQLTTRIAAHLPENPGVVKVTYLTSNGILSTHPQTYEDFLPMSAAGIFQSNLESACDKSYLRENGLKAFDDCQSLENALGCPILDADDYYRHNQVQSLASCAESLGIQIVEA